MNPKKAYLLKTDYNVVVEWAEFDLVGLVCKFANYLGGGKIAVALTSTGWTLRLSGVEFASYVRRCADSTSHSPQERRAAYRATTTSR